MKRTVFYFALLALGLVGTAQTLTKEQWEKDLDYLNNKIQKQFKSYREGIKEQFDYEIDKIKTRLDKLEAYEFPCEVMRALSTLKDGHTELNIGHSNVGFHRMPLLLYYFEGYFQVVAAHEAYMDLLGAKIVAISDTPITQAFDLLKQRMSADNEMEYLHAGPSYIILTELLACIGISSDPNSVEVAFELLNGESVERKFSGLDLETYQSGPWKFVAEGETPLYLTNRKDSYWYKWLPDEQTMYVHIGRLNNQKGAPSIKKFTMEVFSEVDKLRPEKFIIDLRRNNGGNYHLGEPMVAEIKKRQWLNQKGKVWALTGRRTFSAASTMSIFLIKETEVILVGEPSRTHPNQSQNNEYMNLPESNYLIEYSTRIIKHLPDRPDLTMVPVDVEIVPDFDSYRQGKDRVLEYVLKSE